MFGFTQFRASLAGIGKYESQPPGNISRDSNQTLDTALTTKFAFDIFSSILSASAAYAGNYATWRSYRFIGLQYLMAYGVPLAAAMYHPIGNQPPLGELRHMA
jgi:hypothetical protein